nr:Protein C54G4.5 [Haemonchus contortus]
MPPTLISDPASPEHAPLSILVIYSIPALLLLAVVFIIKWRPCYEFSGMKHCFRWYFYCCSKETLKEMQSVDRERILTIDAESLASSSFYDSPRLPLKRNSIELCSAGERQPSIVRLHD